MESMRIINFRLYLGVFCCANKVITKMIVEIFIVKS